MNQSLLGCLTALTCTCLLSARNLFPNPGFEEGLPRLASTNIHARLSKTLPHSGNACAEFTGENDTMNHATWNLKIPVKPQTTYTFTAWLKTRNGTGRVGLFLHDEHGKYIGDNNIWPPSLTGTRDWTRVQIVFNTRNAHFLVPTAGAMGTDCILWVDDLVLKQGIASSSENLLHNSSFKRCETPGYPDCWGIGPDGPLSVDDWEDGNYYGIDNSQEAPVPGARVLFMKAPAAKRLFAMLIPVAPKVPLTFSVYVKADRENYTLIFRGQRFSAGKKWQRASFTFNHPNLTNLWLNLGIPEPKGCLFLSAPQLEYGTQPTPWAEASFEKSPQLTLDKQGTTRRSIDLPHLMQPPQIDGKITPTEWAAAWQHDDFTDNDTGENGPQTKAYFARYKNHLYLAYDCEERGPAPDTKAHGWARFSHNSVECFLQIGKGIIRHLVLNPQGEVFAESGSAFSMSPWKADIHRQISRKTGGWQVEIAIPFSALQPLTEGKWRFNLCRNLRLSSGKTLHLASAGKQSYHRPENFLTIKPFPIHMKQVEIIAPDLANNTLFAICKFNQADRQNYLVKLTDGTHTRTTTIQATTDYVPVLFKDLQSPKPETIITLVLETQKNEKLFTLSRKALHLISKNPESPVQLFGKYNWFTHNDRTIHMKIDSQLTGRQYHKLTQNGKLIREWTHLGPGQLELTLDAKQVRHNDLMMVETWQKDNLRARASETIRILPPPTRRATRVNRFLRALEYDGAPIIPLLFHPVPTRNTPEWIYSFIKKDYYNAVELILPPEMGRKSSLAQIHQHLAATDRHNMPVMVRLNARMTKTAPKAPNTFRDFLNMRIDILSQVVKHDNLLGIYLMDEPTPASWEEKLRFKESDLNTLSRVARTIAPYVPLTINYNHYKMKSPIYGGFASLDFCYMDSYPLMTHRGRVPNPCEIFAQDAWKLNRSIESFGMPAFFWLATYSYGDTIRMPTPPELKNMIYTALIHGSRGIEYFTDYPISVPLIKCIRKVQKNIRQFTPILINENTRITSNQHECMHYAMIELNGIRYLMVANTSSSERKTLKIEETSPLDLQPLAAQIYQLNPKENNWTPWKGK